MTKKIVLKFGEIIKQRGISIRELSRLADVRHATISELLNGKRERIQFEHIEKIADALGIDDIREIITLIDEEENEKDRGI